MRTLFYTLIFCITLSACGCNKKTNPPSSPSDAELDVKILSQGLVHPWEILWGPDNKLWLTERGGKIIQIDPVTGTKNTLLTISDVKAVGEGGLLGMALHPNFTTNPHVFVVYNYDKAGNYTEKVVRYTFNGTVLSTPTIIIDNIAGGNIHNGSRLLIAPDLKLYITTGDAGTGTFAQNRASLNGKVLRINLDGSIPSDNPITGSPVFSLGHRNPQGLVYANDKLYSSEHGPNNDDEINILSKGRNFGWPNVEGICDLSNESAFCTTNNVAEPIMTWTPTIAPSGMDYYNADLIPQWKNSLLLAVLKNSVLLQLKLNDAGDKIESSKEFLKSTYGRLRDLCIAPDGKVYVVTGNGDDKVLVISRTN